jgi:NhaP-type Na+/H+ and K+/H+ antiporter
LPACSVSSLPVPVTLTRFFIPLWVLFFGIEMLSGYAGLPAIRWQAPVRLLWTLG